MTPYFRRDQKDEFQTVRFNEYRELWRDSAALFQVSKDHQTYERAPTCLHTLSAFELQRLLPRSARYRMSVFGLSTDKAKVNFWRHESLPLPLPYLDQPALVDCLKQALVLAERVAREVLRSAVWAAMVSRLTATSDQSPDSKRVAQVVDSLGSERCYWSRLEVPFRDFLVLLAQNLDEREKRLAEWYSEKLHRFVIRAFTETVGRLDGGRDLKAVNAGERVLYGRLKEIEKSIPALRTGDAR
jgi:hypothetical protein